MEQLNIEQFKAEVHRTLIPKLDLEKLSRVENSQARNAVARMIGEIIATQGVPLSLSEQERVQSDLLDEVFGSQDSERRRALLEQLHAIGESEFRQVFVVSHTDDVVQHCDLTIEITRDDNGLSTATGPRR